MFMISVLRMCILNHSINVLSIKILTVHFSLNFRYRSYPVCCLLAPEGMYAFFPKAEVLAPVAALTIGWVYWREMAWKLPCWRPFSYQLLPPTSNSCSPFQKINLAQINSVNGSQRDESVNQFSNIYKQSRGRAHLQNRYTSRNTEGKITCIIGENAEDGVHFCLMDRLPQASHLLSILVVRAECCVLLGQCCKYALL